ncbi:hypothetical protein GA0074695_1985 [Micromonospora viridifaciens]|uniref:Uncharacterized protein n=1 Tax=Micromonospora viridifaciens TaxID=1881 RepID=A0A1C4W0G0_MICVI|nr:hypothetical protein [Micromonospora viridifaciens]SCE89746.1 hypothetical protein GA0074695_1985 [Micromonospora viridifaciens]
MATTDPGSAREEAERLVAMLLATARLAAATPGAGPWGPLGGILSGVLGHAPGGAGDRTASPAGPNFATGSPECCVCPICRVIEALRDPSPEFAERLATGAGDLAAGVASLLRAFAPAEPAGTPEADGPATETPAGDHVWRAATRTGHDSQPAPEQDVWSAATRAEGVADPGATVPPADAAGPEVPVSSRPPAGRPVVPVARASEEVAEQAPGDGA